MRLVFFGLVVLYSPIFAMPNLAVDESALVSVEHEDGKWNILPGLLDFSSHPNVVAIANFTNTQLDNGWMLLEIRTREDVDDRVQARAAGLAEGYLTRTYIVEQYKEFFANDVCRKDPNSCSWLKTRFLENTDYIQSQIDEHANDDPYWHQIDLMYRQMDGVVQGIEMKEEKMDVRDRDMDYQFGVLFLNFIAEFWDMKQQYSLLGNEANKTDPLRPSCSVLIKYVEDRHDILFAHNTWHEYRAMEYRVLKNYNLNFHTLPGSSELIPGHTISMSSYAGVVMSLDDFYLVSSGLFTTETTLFIYNVDLLKNLQVEGVVMEPVRVMISNRLATSGKEWTDIFRKHNSGTYNNQWMVVDYNVLEASNRGNLKDGTLTVLEQLPGKIVVEDQTKALREAYWASYNRAYYSEIFELSGASEKVRQYGDWFTHGKTPRANIFRRDQSKVHDVDSLYALLRYNDFENDPYAVVEGCTPERTPAGAIANRLDLAQPGAKCLFSQIDWMVGHWGYGALDAKVASKESLPSLTFLAVAGPTYNNEMPPFQYSNTNIKDIPEFRPIDKFEFEPFNHTWVLNTGALVRSVGVAFALCLVVVARLV